MLDFATGFGGVPRARAGHALRAKQQIAEQSVRGRPSTGRRWRRGLGAAPACAAYLVLGTVVWAAYDEFGPRVRPDHPALVIADTTPAKVAQAVDRPAVAAIPAPVTTEVEPIAQPQARNLNPAIVAIEGARRPAAPASASPTGAAPRALTLQLERRAAGPGIAAATAGPASAMPLEDQGARRALAALEALHRRERAPLDGPPLPKPAAAGPATGISERPDGARSPAATQARPAAPRPALKPLDAAALAAATDPAPARHVDAAGPAVATTPPVPALKPEGRILMAGARGTDACGAVGDGVLPRDCAVRLAEARDEGLVETFWSRVKELFSSGARSSLVAARDGGQHRGADRSNPGAGPAASTGPASKDAGSPGPARGATDPGTGAGSDTGGRPGGTAGSVGRSVSDALGSVGDTVGSVGKGVGDTAGSVGGRLGGGVGGGIQGGGGGKGGGKGNGGGKGHGGGGKGGHGGGGKGGHGGGGKGQGGGHGNGGGKGHGGGHGGGKGHR